jgi:hypothetical protein
MRATPILTYRAVTIAVVLVVAGASGAAAQFFGAPRSTPPSICGTFAPLQEEAQQGMAALKAANERKASREEFCQIFTRMSGTLGKVSKFLDQNKSTCNIPAEAIQRAKLDHSRVLTYRKQACAVAAGPSGPSLSDVLGAPVLTDSNTARPESNIFNTLTGNPLTR